MANNYKKVTENITWKDTANNYEKVTEKKNLKIHSEYLREGYRKKHLEIDVVIGHLFSGVFTVTFSYLFAIYFQGFFL
jgi:hypothetical protein